MLFGARIDIYQAPLHINKTTTTLLKRDPTGLDGGNHLSEGNDQLRSDKVSTKSTFNCMFGRMTLYVLGVVMIIPN